MLIDFAIRGVPDQFPGHYTVDVPGAFPDLDDANLNHSAVSDAIWQKLNLPVGATLHVQLQAMPGAPTLDPGQWPDPFSENVEVING